MPFAILNVISGGYPALRKRVSRCHARPLAALAGLLAALLTTLLMSAAAQAAPAYQSPFAGEQPYVGRTDMGVDLCLSPGQPIRAIGDGVVVGIIKNWSQGQPYLWYELTDGADAGKYIYLAEQIKSLARIGQTLRPGDVVARYAGKGTCIEIGWSAADGETLAQTTTGYTEGEATVAGVSFARFLLTLGVPGTFDLIPAHATRVKPAAKRKHTKPPVKKKRSAA
jgi:hypothetical protein